MFGMAGKRLATAGLLAAAVAAAAAFWLAPHSASATPAHAVRQVKITVETANLAHVPAVVAQTVVRAGAHSLAGATTAVGLLFGLALLGYAMRHRRQAAPVVVRPSRRGRAPPAHRPYR